MRDRAPNPFYRMLGQTHVNGWSCVIASQNEGSTGYIFRFSALNVEIDESGEQTKFGSPVAAVTTYRANFE